MPSLYRWSSLLDRIGVTATPAGAVTVARVLGDTGIDVHLLLGEEHMTPGQVVSAGTGLLTGRWRAEPGDRLPAPGRPGGRV